MSHKGKNVAGKVGVPGAGEETAHDKETRGEALSKSGFEADKVERKIVRQGKRRETLKRWVSKDPDK
ncbi:hypothetical protein HA464_06790 [Rhizobium leguminosarum bv. trifolii]|uniref:hypothetical protein n=1 Tax=Rhizobium ruizarguesonis TaxID=2081791 RepID=UPI001030CC94|nr:hypothetical protein [Rhizobium ruizarguesonis]QIO43734.1 hypothetical protein HA464_06790 [Rhizobium leguminosarum bv. trifolii]TBE87030.1 hypothetical protein ELG99_09290 [Rhizobium ruizarguesonis]